MAIEIPLLRTAFTSQLTGSLVLAGWAWCLWAGLPLFPSMVLVVMLAAITGVDAATQSIPHTLTGALILSGLALHPQLPHVAAMLLAFGALLGMALLATWLSGEPALGGADLLLTAGIASWISLANLPPFLFATAIIGLAVVMYRRFTQAHTHQFAFGPILALAGWLAYTHGGLYWQGIHTLLTLSP